MSDPFLSVVVPSYRQASTICQELIALDKFLSTIVPSHEIILVIDGDIDHTSEQINTARSLKALRVECLPNNRGKGVALRHGLLCARGELVAFIDAGGDVDQASLEIMLVLLRLFRADIVIGSKRHSLSEISYPPLRRVYSTAYQWLNRLLFKLKIRDTQVGLKLFRREVLAAVLPRIVVKQFAFDLELLVVAYHLGFSRIVEAPVKIQYNFASTIRWRSIGRTLWDTLAIYYRLRILRWYDRPITSQPQPVISSGTVTTFHHDVHQLREKVRN